MTRRRPDVYPKANVRGNLIVAAVRCVRVCVNGPNTEAGRDSNLLPVCSKHHTNIHHDGWVIALGPNRELSLRLPNGTIHNTGPPNRRVA